MKHVRFFAAKTALAVVLAPASSSPRRQAGIPVIDGGSLVQIVMTAIEPAPQGCRRAGAPVESVASRT